MVDKPTTPFIEEDSLYPDSDGQPVGENTIQFRLIMMLQGALDALFKDIPDVFVAGDLFWYPVQLSSEEIENQEEPSRQAPDVMVVFGIKKKDRPSYRQWEENNIAPQVVFEIVSPSNSKEAMTKKFEFYQTHGVEEYYAYNPKGNRLEGWLRKGEVLEEITPMEGWTSPRLGVSLTTVSGELRLLTAEGKQLGTYLDVVQERDRERLEKERERLDKELERQRANAAELERDRQQQRANDAQATIEQLRDRLQQLGVDPDRI
ncbi:MULTISPECIES: Uma2 family endonuclease [unclassified Roseofilum]|uniref:Uma2 family endonuclease n=1 Tax=unclassified Roseofilum TaxID=2620099 RepID=UPI001B1304E6|nr:MULTISPECIES: Uma2 family endonuclease [unclassified Roseofilum]MBP0008477.1 Uma2 family endonuclease [Roseofilum sp. Belize Diploria]MBP0035776.1 Uma2 family endonuclease [Roseofilum sp. Belize BBD 4]